MSFGWLDSASFSLLGMISERKARLALSRAIAGATWRGTSLVVRTHHSRGGRSGLRYEVRVDSLPVDLQRRFRDAYGEAPPQLSHGPKAQEERDFWFYVISPALEHPKGSRGRGEAIRQAAEIERWRPGRKPFKITERSIQRKLNDYEAHGLGGLSRAKRSDAGEAAVILSRSWDRAVPFDDQTKERIAHELRQYVRGLTKKGEAGKSLQLLASAQLAMLTQRAGFNPDRGKLAAACAVPSGLIQEERDFRKVHEFKTNRKAYEDAGPRIQRTRNGLLPMDIVVADIHPIDIYCNRSDGSTATPRGIAWLDLATNRIFVDVVLLEKGEGITNAHVIASFINMVRAWGCPRALYLDNGSEYNWADFVSDALKLIDQQGRHYLDRVAAWAERESSIVRAMPYNAAAKPIEGIFAVLEPNHFSLIPGYVGGDRLNKKTANVGKAPEPFPGSFDELRSLIAASLLYYHALPQNGSLGRQSPGGAYAKAIQSGWGMTAIDPNAFRLAFAKPESRVVQQGSVRHGGRIWTSPELQAYLGKRVSLLVPRYEENSRLAVNDESDRFLCFVEPGEQFGLLDPRGAQESARRKSLRRGAIRELDKAAPDVDPLAERLRAVNALPAPPTAPIVATIGPSDHAKAIFDGWQETHADREDRLHRTNQDALKKRIAVRERVTGRSIING